ncbi:MAG TPA: protein kinase [Vicinamibacterales bacterium]|nr:protein kinase [Vicinamibacterales bacterium]
MSLAAGTRIGPYAIGAPIGAGGMGEVYRARDARLDRDVAIKILPEAFAIDPDRLARFEREAKTLASLNHPNIAAIHGVEHTGASRALVMELVEGVDLSERIHAGAMPIADVLAIAQQIAAALEAAHDAGIVHRDLKPANIKVRHDGTVKVLDFGLAKPMALAGASGTGDPYNSPTITSPAMTAMGVILGTAAYMAPEQAKGRAVDRRADIWAFGVILYEMLTGRACFDGDTVGEVMASVMKDAPDLTALPAGTPAPLRRLLARCLEKDPRRRLSAIGDARWDLEESTNPGAALGGPATARPWLLWLSSAAAVAAIAVAAWALVNRPAADAPGIAGRFTIELPDESPLVIDDQPRPDGAPLAISPDGRHIVYVAPHGTSTKLFVRALADEAPRALEGTEGGRMPFFSPDNQSIGFFAGGKLKRTRLTGGTPSTIADADDGGGASWGSNGEIVFSANGDGLFLVPEGGGAARRLTSLDAHHGEDVHGYPHILPEHGAALFTVAAWSREAIEIFVVDLKTGARRLVQDDAWFARYVPPAAGSAGHLLFVRGGTLFAAPFDPAGQDRAGTPVAVLDGVRDRRFDIAAGVLVYAPAASTAAAFSLVWVDRTGNETPINDVARGYEDLHLSPDGRRVAATLEEPGPDTPAHVWLAGTLSGTLTRFTFDGFSRDPVWSPDGQSIVYGSKRGKDTFGLYVQRLDGQSPAELVYASTNALWPDPQSWSPDGNTIVFNHKDSKTGDDIWTLALDTRTPRPWLATPDSEGNGRLSPDGRWMAYHSNASGRYEVYVQPYPGPGSKHLVSQGGGLNPIWSRDGREIFYRHDADLLVVNVDTTAGFTAGNPAVMFSGRYRFSGRDFDVSPDGTRFVMMRVDSPRTGNRLRVLVEWRRLLDDRLKGSR